LILNTCFLFIALWFLALFFSLRKSLHNHKELKEDVKLTGIYTVKPVLRGHL